MYIVRGVASRNHHVLGAADSEKGVVKLITSLFVGFDMVSHDAPVHWSPLVWCHMSTQWPCAIIVNIYKVLYLYMLVI